MASPEALHQGSRAVGLSGGLAFAPRELGFRLTGRDLQSTLHDLVLHMILMTVVIQGLTAPRLASRLGPMVMEGSGEAGDAAA